MIGKRNKIWNVLCGVGLAVFLLQAGGLPAAAAKTKHPVLERSLAKQTRTSKRTGEEKAAQPREVRTDERARKSIKIRPEERFGEFKSPTAPGKPTELEKGRQRFKQIQHVSQSPGGGPTPVSSLKSRHPALGAKNSLFPSRKEKSKSK